MLRAIPFKTLFLDLDGCPVLSCSNMLQMGNTSGVIVLMALHWRQLCHQNTTRFCSKSRDLWSIWRYRCVTRRALALKISPEGQELWRATYLDPVYGLGGTDVRWIGDRWVFWGRNNAGNGYRYFAWQLGTDGANLGSAISEFNAELFYTQHIDKQGNLLA